MSGSTDLNCLQIVEPYIRAVSAEGMPAVQLMGGVGSAALRHPNTVIKIDEQRIIAPTDLWVSQHRPDGNLRDVETLVLSANPDDTGCVQACLDETVGDELIKEVFGYGDIARADELRAAPFGSKVLIRSFLSDRYGSTANSRVDRMIFPFLTEIEPDALATWTLEVGDLEVPVPSPGAVIINYLTRSISGLRKKDAQKVYEMAASIFAEAPELMGWVQDGPGKSQFEMARILQTLCHGSSGQSLVLGDSLAVTPLASDLTVHEQFMLHDASDLVKRHSLLLAITKSRGLRKAESMDKAVTFFQKYLEPRLHTIVHNK